MASAPSTSQSAYHQYVPAEPSEKFLLCSKDKSSFRVGCSKALLNSLLQRQQFDDDIKFTLDPMRLENILYKLHLERFFKLSESNEFLSSDTANAVGSILAAHEVLLHFNVFIHPIDNTTYTVLVEKPSGFICLMDDGWVVMRNIGGTWLEMDRRKLKPRKLSENFLCLIIKQLLVDNQPVFWISGEGFSRQNPVQGLIPSQQPVAKTGVNVVAASLIPPPPRAPNANVPRPPPANLPRPPPANLPRPPPANLPRPPPANLPRPPPANLSRPPHATLANAVTAAKPPVMLNQNEGNISRLQTQLNRLEIASSQATKNQAKIKTKIKTETRVSRSRSEVRREAVPTSSGYLEPSTQSAANFDWEWPPLPSGQTRYRRARSTSRVRPQSQPQVYRPPADVVERSTREAKVTRHESRRDKVKKKEDSRCCICLESFPDFALIPCGHQCLCVNCHKQFLSKFAVCPICNNRVTGALKIFKT